MVLSLRISGDAIYSVIAPPRSFFALPVFRLAVIHFFPVLAISIPSHHRIYPPVVNDQT